MSDRAVPTLGERAFGALLRLYPRSFRKRFGDDMALFYRECRNEHRHRGNEFAVARLWLHLIADVAMSAPVEHWRALTRTPTDKPSWASPDYPPETYPMESLKQDIRYALRSLLRYPSFAMVAVLTLALGIGATTSIFSVVDAVLLRPLPWPDPDRMTFLFTQRGTSQTSLAYLDYKDWRDQSTSFAEFGVFRGQSINLTGVETPDRLTGAFVDAGMFRVSGASAQKGRLFTNSETEVATREPAAVISDAAWRTRFGARADMVGQKLVLNGQPFTVVGIMRPGFVQPFMAPDVWMPIGYYPNSGDLANRGRGGVQALATLKPGVTFAAAQADLDAISKRLAETFPTTNGGSAAGMQPLKEILVGPSRAPLYIVLASVGVVLLIACANVANLQLARATARQRELSVRAALGAGRSRLMRQLLTENVVLSAAGGAGGLVIAYGGVQWFASVAPTILPVSTAVTLSGGVLAFAAIVTLATGLIFGVAPAWSATRARLHDALKLRGDGGVARLRAHNALVVAQIAACVVLLVSAGLLTRSLVALSRVNPGFDARQVVTMQFRLPATSYDSEAKIASMFARAIAEVRAVPGVRSAALVRATPLNGNGELLPYGIEGTAQSEPEKLPRAHVNIISSDYFETMRIPMRAGRDFEDGDLPTSMRVAIVNEQLAAKVAPTGSPLGRRVRLSPTDTSSPWTTIVGVVGNAKHFSVNEQQTDQVYVPFTQRPLIFTELVARSDGDLTAVANAMRAAIWRVDRDQPVWRIRPLMLSIENQLGTRTFTMRLIASFAVLAVVLAIIGVYGVMSYAVARRANEMGIRMALGAQTTQVVGMVVRQGMRTVGLAIAIGVGLSLAATKLLETQLYGVGRTDPLTFATVAAALGLVALAACMIPARRASRVDPVIALRTD